MLAKVPGPRWLSRTIIAALLAVIILGVGVKMGVPLYPKQGPRIPEEGDGLSGFGDTMLRYEDRNYEGTRWKELTVDQKKEWDQSDQWRALLSYVDEHPSIGDLGLTRVVGWDADNFWVVGAMGDKTQIFHYDAGHPSKEVITLAGISKPRARLLDVKTLLVAEGAPHIGNIYSVSLPGGGISTPTDQDKIQGCLAIFPIAPDRYYFTTAGGTIIKIDKGVKGERTNLSPPDPQVIVHEGRKQLDGYHVRNIDLTRTYARGRAFGVAISDAPAKGPPIVAELNNGTIWELRKRLDLLKPNIELTDNWLFAEGSTPKGVVVVGKGGHVVYQEFRRQGDRPDDPRARGPDEHGPQLGLGRRAGEVLGHGQHRARLGAQGPRFQMGPTHHERIIR